MENNSKGTNINESPLPLALKRNSDNDFSERSELTHEIISRKPDFYEKWALSIFIVLLILLALSTWFIKYPDVIYADAILTSSDAPKQIISKQSGKVIALYVNNNQLVKQGEILGWIESTADTKEVIELSNRLDSAARILGTANPKTITNLFTTKLKNLGELQSHYQIFNSAWIQYNDYLVNGYYSYRKSLLQKDISALQKIEERRSSQKEITTQDNELARRTFEMNESLFKEKVISAEEYRKAQSTLLNKRKNAPEMEITIISQQSQIREKQKEINQLDHDILMQQQTFEQALHTLRSNVGDWLRKYAIQAPTSGTIVFALPIQQNHYLEQGKILGYVNPPDSKYYVELKLSQNNFSKVDTGMKVQLRFDAYPYQEIGHITGTLKYISNIAVDSGFLGTVQLDNGFISSENKIIQYKSGLKASALIIANDSRLLERIYYSIVKATSVKK